MKKEDTNVGNCQRQGWGDNPAWTTATVTAPAHISKYQDHNGGGQYVSASSWQDCPTGPPATTQSLLDDQIEREKKTMTYGLYSGGTSMEQKTAAINLIDYGLN